MNVGAFAEFYRWDLRNICLEWLMTTQKYYRAHPYEINAAMQQRMDVAASLVQTTS